MEDFKTSDIVLAACLRMNDKEMVRIEIIGNKGTFVFADVSDDFIQQYDLGHQSVEPVSFNNTVKQLTTSVRRMTRQAPRK